MGSGEGRGRDEIRVGRCYQIGRGRGELGSRFGRSRFDEDASRSGLEGVGNPGEKVGPLEVDSRNFIGTVDRRLKSVNSSLFHPPRANICHSLYYITCTCVHGLTDVSLCSNMLDPSSKAGILPLRTQSLVLYLIMLVVVVTCLAGDVAPI
eukprot:sb/3473487/